MIAILLILSDQREMTTEYPDRFKNFFEELESRRALLTTITDTHKKLINSFVSLDETLTKKSQILDTQIENFRKKTEKTLEALKVRENSIPDKEVTLVASVEQLKDAGIREIEKGNNYDPEAKTTAGLLKMWFRRMDSKGLVKFLLEKRKELLAVRAEITVAAGEAVDLPGFVLEAVEDLVESKVSGIKVKGMADRRWACGILIHAAFPIGSDIGGVGIGRNIKERALKVLEVWKGVLGGGGDGGGGSCGNRGGGDSGGGLVGSGEATMFLQMVIGFGLRHNFDDEFLMKLVLDFASKRDIAKIAVALGFGDKMRDLIEELVKTGKVIEAVYFVFEAGLTEQFPPVPLLKSILEKSRENTSKVLSSLDDVYNEMIIIKSVIKCIEDHKLESQFGIDDLNKRLSELDTIKAKKMSNSVPASTSKNKRSRSQRGGGGGSSRPPKAVRLAMASRQENKPAPPFAASYMNPPTAAYGGQSSVRYGLQYAYPSTVATYPVT